MNAKFTYRTRAAQRLAVTVELVQTQVSVCHWATLWLTLLKGNPAVGAVLYSVAIQQMLSNLLLYDLGAPVRPCLVQASWFCNISHQSVFSCSWIILHCLLWTDGSKLDPSTLQPSELLNRNWPWPPWSSQGLALWGLTSAWNDLHQIDNYNCGKGLYAQVLSWYILPALVLRIWNAFT